MKLLWEYDMVVRTIKRITHEIIEREASLDNVVLLGIEKSGVLVAKMIHSNLKKFEGLDVPLYGLDISSHRDDVKKKDGIKLDLNVTNKHVILVDDVLYTGRTARAAMDTVIDLGRPSTIQLAVLIDRGHRELPIRADYVGKNIPTRFDEKIVVNLKDKEGVFLTTK
jgi:pyrimidine operon attenuation protein/uracil phosphoribosyltransferase